MTEINDLTFLNIVISIVAILVAIASAVFAYLQLVQSRKNLAYEIQAITSVFTITKGFKEQLEIKLNGKIVRRAYLVIIRIANTGRTSIKPEDFVQPLKLAVQNGKIISADISNTNPPELEEVIQIQDETTIVLRKILLNSKDEFTLQLLLSDFSGKDKDIKIEGRIEGVKRITNKPKKDEHRVISFSSFALIFILLQTIVFFGIFMSGYDVTDGIFALGISLLLILGGYGMYQVFTIGKRY